MMPLGVKKRFKKFPSNIEPCHFHLDSSTNGKVPDLICRNACIFVCLQVPVTSISELNLKNHLKGKPNHIFVLWSSLLVSHTMKGAG